jgi:hypothetical protein
VNNSYSIEVETDIARTATKIEQRISTESVSISIIECITGRKSKTFREKCRNVTKDMANDNTP